MPLCPAIHTRKSSGDEIGERYGKISITAWNIPWLWNFAIHNPNPNSNPNPNLSQKHMAVKFSGNASVLKTSAQNKKQRNHMTLCR